MDAVDPDHLPQHIGIIMDGNGRWARRRKLKRTAGHKEGLSAAKRVIARAAEIGIPNVTLYTFSTENWRRSSDEVNFLFNLINIYLRKEMDFYREKEIRVIHSGDLENIPDPVRRELLSVCNDTANFTHLTVCLAINYGGRNEIVRGIQRYLEERENSPESAVDIDEESLRSYFDHPELPDADLIIRTAGEKRLSNFLLWDAAYAELYFSDKLWPDWSAEDLDEAVRDYQRRIRRYGGVA